MPPSLGQNSPTRVDDNDCDIRVRRPSHHVAGVLLVPWRVGDDDWSPERASFADFIDGRPQAFIFSGEKFLRHDI